MAYRLVKIDFENRSHHLMLRNYEVNKKHVQHASLFSPSPNHVLTVTVNGFFSLANLRTNAFELFLTHLESLPFEAPIRCAALNVTPTAVRVVYALGHDRTLLVGDFDTGAIEALHQFTARPSCIHCDGDYTVAGDGSGEVALWRHAASGGFHHQWTMTPQEAGVSSLLISRHLVVSSAEDFVIVVQNVQGVRLARLPTQASGLSLFAFGASTHPNTHPLDLGVVTEAGTLTTWERQGTGRVATPHKSGEKVPMGEGDIWVPLSVQQLGFEPHLGATASNNNFLCIGGSDGEVSLYDASDSKSVIPLVGFKVNPRGLMVQRGSEYDGSTEAQDQGASSSSSSSQVKILQCSVTNDSHLVVVTSTGDVWRWPLSDVLPSSSSRPNTSTTINGEMLQDTVEEELREGERRSSDEEEPRPESRTPQPSAATSTTTTGNKSTMRATHGIQQPEDEADVLNVEDTTSSSGAAPFQFDNDATFGDVHFSGGGGGGGGGGIDMMPSLQREPSPEQAAHMMMSASVGNPRGGTEEEEVIYMGEEDAEGSMDGFSVATPVDAQTVYSRSSAGGGRHNSHHGLGRPPRVGTGTTNNGRSTSQDLGGVDRGDSDTDDEDEDSIAQQQSFDSPIPNAPRGAALRQQAKNDDDLPPQPSHQVPHPSESPQQQQHHTTTHYRNHSGSQHVNVSVSGLQAGKRMDPRAVQEVLCRGAPTSPENQSAVNQSVLGLVNQSQTTNMLEQSRSHIQQQTFSAEEYKAAHAAEVKGLMFEHGITSPRYALKEDVYSEEVLNLGGGSPRGGGGGAPGTSSVSTMVLLDRTNLNNNSGGGDTIVNGTKDTLLNQTVLATGGKRKIDAEFLKQRSAPEPKIDDHLCHDLLFGSSATPGNGFGILAAGGSGVVSSIFLDEHTLEPAPPQQLLLPLPMAPTPSVF